MTDRAEIYDLLLEAQDLLAEIQGDDLVKGRVIRLVNKAVEKIDKAMEMI